VISAQQALQQLRDGNRRFVSDDSSHSKLTHRTSRDEMLAGQAPFAIVLGCSDSRVPTEIIFDQGLGDLFVIRVVGNIVAPSQMGSVEFAAERFGTRLVVVLGHSHCSAVLTAIEELERPADSRSPNLAAIVDFIRPSVQRAIAVRKSTIARRAGEAGHPGEHPRLGKPSEISLEHPKANDPKKRPYCRRRRVFNSDRGCLFF
jgi:carbonic anhydrase